MRRHGLLLMRASLFSTPALRRRNTPPRRRTRPLPLLVRRPSMLLLHLRIRQHSSTLLRLKKASPRKRSSLGKGYLCVFGQK